MNNLKIKVLALLIMSKLLFYFDLIFDYFYMIKIIYQWMKLFAFFLMGIVLVRIWKGDIMNQYKMVKDKLDELNIEFK